MQDAQQDEKQNKSGKFIPTLLFVYGYAKNCKPLSLIAAFDADTIK